MADKSLFTRLTRFASNPRREPYEERLTEAFAATLAASPEATAELLSSLEVDCATTAPSEQPHVVTQRRTPVGDRVDIEVRYGPASRPTNVVWFELKWGAPADAGQLRRYADAQKTMPWPHALVFVAPSDPGFAADVPGSAVTWQRVASILAEWHRAAKDIRAREHGTAMVDAFVCYLEENSLAMTGAFSLTDAIALDEVDGARGRFKQILDRAFAELEGGSDPPLRRLSENGEGNRSDPRQFFWHYELRKLPAARSSHHWYELHGRQDAARARPRGEHIIGAGLASSAENAFGPEGAEWIASLEQRGFEYGPGDDHMYLFRYKTYAEVAAAGADLDEQGANLAKWVVETFELLAQKPWPGPE